MTTLCSDDELGALVKAMQSPETNPIDRLDEFVNRFPDDPRLHFLRGSALIGLGRHIEAHRSLSRAVEIAPDFAIARFQLGFFQLTSGEAANALETWGRLDGLPDGHYLRNFADGLRCLIRDNFTGAIERLRDGIGLNQENAPLNHDMALIIERCRTLATQSGANVEFVASETSLMLERFSGQANAE